MYVMRSSVDGVHHPEQMTNSSFPSTPIPPNQPNQERRRTQIFACKKQLHFRHVFFFLAFCISLFVRRTWFPCTCCFFLLLYCSKKTVFSVFCFLLQDFCYLILLCCCSKYNSFSFTHSFHSVEEAMLD